MKCATVVPPVYPVPLTALVIVSEESWRVKLLVIVTVAVVLSPMVVDVGAIDAVVHT